MLIAFNDAIKQEMIGVGSGGKCDDRQTNVRRETGVIMNGHKSVSQYDWTTSDGKATYRITVLDNGRVCYYQSRKDAFGTLLLG